MGASEHEREAPIGHPLLRVGGLLQFRVDQLERFRRVIDGASPARSINEAPPRRLRKPPFRVRGDALVRPYGKRRSEGVGERVLGSRHVARRRREIGDELAVALTRHSGRDSASVSVAARRRLWKVRGPACFCFQIGHSSRMARSGATQVRLRLSRGHGSYASRRTPD